uniref:Uncharacterized protein n=1 Tax=Arundo donax TaxID=35708 RepID=A0A0A8YYY6_ARUDO
MNIIQRESLMLITTSTQHFALHGRMKPIFSSRKRMSS